MMITDSSRGYYCRLWNVLLLQLPHLFIFLVWSLLSNDPLPVASAFNTHFHLQPVTNTLLRPRKIYNKIIALQYTIDQRNYRGCQQLLSTNNGSGEVDDDETKDIYQPHHHGDHHRRLSRRHWLVRSAKLSSSAIVMVPLLTTMESSIAADPATVGKSVYVPAVRPTVYRVDSTIPPTLLPVPKNQDQKKLLRDLGRGLGTDKREVFIDRLNLNNILQKAVYGTVDAVKSLTRSNQEIQKAPASFICFGLPMQVTNRDIELTVSLFRGVFEKRLSPQQRPPSAIGIATLPCTAQNIVDDLVANRRTLSDISSSNGVDDDLQQLLPLYRPIFEYAIENKIPMIAMGLSKEDERTVQKGGIQSVNPTSREKYVKDPNGFIATTNDPKFKLYTDRSLLKDRLLVSKKDATTESISEGNYFAERILSHEAGATFVSQYAIDHRVTDDCCVIAIVAPMNDVRYLGGINGRIPRIYQYLSGSTTTPNNADGSSSSTSTDDVDTALESLISMNDITTILINPTAVDTLSRTVRLRLEIGTGPDTIPYQTKIADYLWFSSSPPVNILPRVMDY